MTKKPQFSDDDRRRVWMISSGAANSMESYQSVDDLSYYWSIIENYDRNFPNPNDH